jgi:hypothetical protein
MLLRSLYETNTFLPMEEGAYSPLAMFPNDVGFDRPGYATATAIISL